MENLSILRFSSQEPIYSIKLTLSMLPLGESYERDFLFQGVLNFNLLIPE